MEKRSPTARGRQDTGGWWRAEGATTRHPSPPRAAALRAGRRAFTLTELLIVIGLIVLVIALAVPAFRAMTGGRSIDAAQNQLSAVLGAARAEAIGLQKVRGVFFYIDPATERVNAVLVQDAAYQPERAPDKAPDLYLDLVPDRDPVALPMGIGIQGIDNCNITGNPPTRNDDGYIGFNTIASNQINGPPPSVAVRFGGVILFDGYGRVVQKYYGFLLGRGGTGASRNITATRLGEVFGYDPGSTTPDIFVPEQQLGGNNPANEWPPQSLFGFVLFDAETFRAAGSTTDADPQMNQAAGNYTDTEVNEETWLDKNAFPVLINRYNGTLVRGE
jgi:type II secretory pathway pseudopilin PulG